MVVVGAGAAGRAITLLLVKAGIKEVMWQILKERFEGRPGLEGYKCDLAKMTNLGKNIGRPDASDRRSWRDCWRCLVRTIMIAHIEQMSPSANCVCLRQIQFRNHAWRRQASWNSGNYDWSIWLSNQINNSLAFRVSFVVHLIMCKEITDDMKLAAARKNCFIGKKADGR